MVRTRSLRPRSARHRVDHGTICGRSCANSGHYKPLCACVDRTFVNPNSSGRLPENLEPAPRQHSPRLVRNVGRRVAWPCDRAPFCNGVRSSLSPVKAIAPALCHTRLGDARAPCRARQLLHALQSCPDRFVFRSRGLAHRVDYHARASAIASSLVSKVISTSRLPRREPRCARRCSRLPMM
jgi:hypothetical protein